jgi:acetyl esterase/lipase
MLLSPEELAQSSIPLPEVVEACQATTSPSNDTTNSSKFAAANSTPPADWNDVKAIISIMDTTISTINATLPPAPDILESNLTVPMRDGHPSIAIIRKPQIPSPKGSPLIILAFGGGWISGSADQMALEARALVRVFSAVVVNISYRLAPEHKFPQSWEDAWDNLVWLVEHAVETGADPSRGIIMGGTSAGASLAAVCARRAQVEPLAYPLTGQWLNVPTLLKEEQVPEEWTHLYVSMEQNKDAAIFPASAMAVLQELTGWDMASPWRLPLNSTHSLAGLPKTYIQVDGMDCLRDDGLLYDEMLKAEGVESRCDLYAGCPHAHATFVPGKAAEKALVDLVESFGWMLGQVVREGEAEKALGLL